MGLCGCLDTLCQPLVTLSSALLGSQCVAVCCRETLQHTAAHYNTLQHTVTLPSVLLVGRQWVCEREGERQTDREKTRHKGRKG